MSNATESSEQDKPATESGRRPSPGLGLRECPVCGKKFQPYRAWQRACSRKCRELSPVDPAHLMPVPFTCKRCGAGCVGYATGGGGRYSYCDECKPIVRREQLDRKNAARNKQFALDPVRRAERKRKGIERYGISQERYEDLLAMQSGACAICGRPPSGKGPSGQRLHVDHDHRCCSGTKSCGECVRGLLCSSCNMAIGYLQDDPAVIQAAVDYLRSF